MDSQLHSTVQMLDNRTAALENRMRLPRVGDPAPPVGSVPTYTGGQTNLEWDYNALPSGQAEGDILFFDGTDWTTLFIGAEDQVLTVESDLPQWKTPDPSDLPTPTSGNILIADGTDWVSTSASDGELLIGDASGWTPTSAGDTNTLLRSNGTTLAYDIAIEDGSNTGEIMVWDTTLGGGVGGIKSNTLPGSTGIVAQAATGTISHIIGVNGIPWYTAAGQPQFASLPSTAGLLYYNGSGTFSAVSIPSGGLLTGNTTGFGSESYIKTSNYFKY